MLSGYTRDPTVDEVSRKEYLRKNRRRPIEQTVAELGEGRGEASSASYRGHKALTAYLGIYAPGYEERRRERIKQNLGIDVSGVPSAH